MEQKTTLVQSVKEYKAGKTEAFDALYWESYKYIYTCVYKVMSGNDNAQDIIEEIMQDTYLEICKSLSQLEDEERFLQWAGMIATRKCYAYIKKNKKYVLLNEEDSTFDTLADSDDIIPESVVQSKEKQRLVRNILETELTEIQKLCITAYVYNDKKVSEIAEEFGIPENTVKTHLFRAKGKIKDGVLDLEKREGTKLYSVAPFLLLLFKEDVQAASVPNSVTKKVMSSVSLGARATTAGTISSATTTGANVAKEAGKAAAISMKTKIIGGLIAVGLLGAVGGTVYVASQDKQEVNVQQEVAANVVEATGSVETKESVEAVEKVEANTSATTETKEESSSKKKKEKEPYVDRGIWMKDRTIHTPDGFEDKIVFLPDSSHVYVNEKPIYVTESITVYNRGEEVIGYLKPNVEFSPTTYNEEWVIIPTDIATLYVKTEELVAVKGEDCPLLEVEKEKIPEAIPDEDDPNIMLFTEDKSCQFMAMANGIEIYDNYENGNVIHTVPGREVVNLYFAYLGYTVNTDTIYGVIEYEGNRAYVKKDYVIRMNVSIDEIEQ